MLKGHDQRAFFGAALLLLMIDSSASLSAQSSNIQQISYGNRHLCVVTTRGELVCWGDNSFGQIGNGKGGKNGRESRVLNPTLIFASGVTAASAGYAHTCAVVNGALNCWGVNASGQIGNGEIDVSAADKNVRTPTQIIARGVKAVASGGMHTCAVVGESLQCWGAGQIGTGSTSGNILKPVTILASGVKAVAASNHTCAVVRDDLLCWGENRSGQIGVGATGNSVPFPTKIISGGVSAVVVGQSNTCAIVKGALWCWGANAKGILAPEAMAIVPSPRQIIASGVTAVAVDFGRICAVVRGALQCWGNNAGSTLGTGKRDEKVMSPREVIPHGVTAVVMGENATCAVVEGALRCRGHDPYTHEDITAAEFSPFNQSAGDVATISHGAADAEAELEKSPARVAVFLKGRIIHYDGAAYYVSSARGGLRRFDSAGLKGRGLLNLKLDVIPLFPVTLRQPHGDAAGKDSLIVVSNDAQCGINSTLPGHLDTTNFQVQSENRFISLGKALQTAFSPLLDIESAAGSFSASAGDLAKIQTCANQLLAASDKRPFQSIFYQVGGEILTVPPTLDGVWHHGGADAIENINVAPGGMTGDYSAQAQALSTLQCGDTLLSHWKPWQSLPIDLQSSGYFFYVDHGLLVSRAREYPVFSQSELRRAINAERGTAGLASEEEARTCLPRIIGEHFSISYGGRVVQQLAIGLKQPEDIFRLDCAEGTLCKPLPDNNGKSIVVLIPHSNGPGNFGVVQKKVKDDSFRDESIAQSDVYDLQIFIIKSGTNEVYSRFLQKQAYVSTVKSLIGFEIDTGRYSLAPGVRAFGVRAHYSASATLSPAGETTLKLFVQNGEILHEVLNGLVVSKTGGEWTGSCTGHATEIKRIIDIGKQSSHGLRDLEVTSTVTTTDSKMENGKCVDTRQKPRTEQVTLRYDGEKYAVPATLSAAP